MTGSPEVVSFRTLRHDPYSAITEPGVMVVRDQRTWDELRTASTAHLAPRPTLPLVDWADHMLIAVALGFRPSAGYSVEIRRLTLQGNVLTVHAQEDRPGPETFTADVITHPVLVVSTARRDAEVMLEMMTVTSDLRDTP